MARAQASRVDPAAETAAEAAAEAAQEQPATGDTAAAEPDSADAAAVTADTATEIPDTADAATEGGEAALQRVRAAQQELAAARTQAAVQLPGGYVIATERLYVEGGARAHNAGDRVPVGNVERNGWQDKVRPPADGE